MMGLFDIFRRKKKKAAESAAPTSTAAASEEVASQAPASAESEAPTPASEAPASSSVSSEVASESAAPKEQAPESEAASATSAAPVEPTSEAASEAPHEGEPETTEGTGESTTPVSAKEEATTGTVEEAPASEAATSEGPHEEGQPESAAVSEATSAASDQLETPTPGAQAENEEQVATSDHEGKAEESTATASADEGASEEAAATTSTSEEAEETSEPATSEAPASAAEPTKDQKYERGLAKSRTGFGARLNKFLANFRHVDEDFFDDLEDLLIESDVGYEMAMQLADSLREEVKLQNAKSKQDVSNVIIEKMVDLYEAAGKDEQTGINFAKEGPTVIMFVGVNGAGKTTTIGKLAAAYKQEGKRVLLAAADTFRAGATEQLEVWAERDGVDIVTGPEKGDPAAVVFDAVKKAKEEDYDVLFVDTAGRLQNKVNLMNELAKMKKILTREIPDAPHEVLLVLDSTTGQNALNQAKLFKESTDVTGIVLTKLDGTARGGIVLAIRNELHLPVKYVGLGERVGDLEAFDPAEFVYGLFKGLVVTD